jgi:hypothetical protein
MIDCLLCSSMYSIILIFKVRVCVVTPEFLDLSAIWISYHRAPDLSSITPQLRGSISDRNTAVMLVEMLLQLKLVLDSLCHD